MVVLSPIRPVSLREQVVEQIRTAIIEGRLQPNDHITEMTLTEQLGVSRTPVREALILLEREGLVISAPNRGCFVRAFNRHDIGEIFSMRTALENFAGEVIIERLTRKDYDYLRAMIEEQRQSIEADDFKKVRSIDMAFHRFLVMQSGHAMLVRSWTEIVAQIAALLHMRRKAMPEYDEYLAIRDHQAIVDAYASRDLERLKALNQQINQRVAGECLGAVPD